jgi:hypothetical protein
MTGRHLEALLLALRRGDFSAVTLHALADVLTDEGREQQAGLFRVLARGTEEFPKLARRAGARGWLSDAPKDGAPTYLATYRKTGWFTNGRILYRPDEQEQRYLDTLEVVEGARVLDVAAVLARPSPDPLEWVSLAWEGATGTGTPLLQTARGTCVPARRVGFLARRFPLALWYEEAGALTVFLFDGEEPVAAVSASRTQVPPSDSSPETPF